MKFERTSQQGRLKVYLRLLGYVKPYAGVFALSVLGFVAFAVTEPAQAKLLGMMIDAVLHKDYDARYYIPALLVSLYVLRGIASYVGNYFLARVSNGVVNDLRNQLFSHIIYLPTRFYDDNNSGHIISRVIFNTAQVTGAATDALKTIIREGATVIALFAYIFYLNWKMSLVFIAVVPIIALLVTNVGNKLRKLSTKLQDSAAELTQVCNEAVMGHRVVRSFSGEEYEVSRFAQASRGNMRRALKMASIAAASTSAQQLLIITAMAFIMFLILQPAFLAEMSASAYVTYLTALGMVPKPLRQLSEVNGVIQKGIAAAESVFEIIDLQKETNTGTRSADGLQGRIEISKLSFRYPDSPKLALTDIDLTIEPGQTVALVGRSGSGKSTLASLIARYYRHETGSIRIDDTDIDAFDLYSLRENIAVVTQAVTLFNDTITNNIAYGRQLNERSPESVMAAAQSAYAQEFIEALPAGFDTLVGENGVKLSGGQKQRIAIVPQDVALFNRTIMENLRYARPEASDEDVARAVDSARCRDFIEAMPQGFYTPVGNRGTRLSGGQRQRLAIARALLKDAPIMILDEATSALDNESERFIQLALERAMRDRTTLVIAHRLSTIESADLIVVMDQGRIVEQGTHAELLARAGAYAKLHSNNFDVEKV